MEQTGTTQTPVTITLVENQLSVTMADGQEYSLAVGQHLCGWTLRWLHSASATPKALLESTNHEGGALLFWSSATGIHKIIKPVPKHYDNPSVSQLYNGHTMAEILASQHDLLGEEVLAQGEPSYASVVGLLPPMRGGRYQILGSPLSRGKFIIWPDGTVTTQAREKPNVIYAPAAVDSRTSRCKVYDGLLADWMPIACYRFEGDDAVYDLLAFVLPDDYAIVPEPFFCLARYEKDGYTPAEVRYKQIPREGVRELSAEKFYEALEMTVRFWRNYEQALTHVQLPEERIWRWTIGCLALAATTFAGDHPKYGTVKYGREFADTFPPTLLTIAETHLAWGATQKANDYLRYYLTHVVRDDGTFNFRGPSGTEYGQWLWLLNEVERIHGPQPWIARDLDKMIATGHFLEGLRYSVGDPPLRLVRIAAEDDNRHEDHVYFSNNLWVVRGLFSLATLLERHNLVTVAEEIHNDAASLRNDLRQAIHLYAQPTELGPLLPSYIGYPADLWTMSVGPSLSAEVPEWERQAFYAATGFSAAGINTPGLVPKDFGQSAGAPSQWIRENTYANYRYHLEALAVMELDHEHAQALMRLRKERGGQTLGTTRVFDWLDDWPVAAYARYLLSTDQIDDYLLLFYGHMAHHGNRETLTYYEGVMIDGEIRANDCVPSLLITPIMARWMLCFEPIGESAIYLLRATPRAWFTPGAKIAAQGLVSSVGPLDITVAVAETRIMIELTLPKSTASHQLYLDVRLPDARPIRAIQSDTEWISEIRDGYRLVLHPGTTGALHIELEF